MAETLHCPVMAAGSHKFQAPKGTRDFYSADMAVRRHIEKVWREVSINYGFDEIDGPTFEHLELYTVKSGPGIVNELFSFRRAGGESDYALRPEFTPTLARMYAAQAGSLPKPTKWFCMPSFFRAERPQRGRLREFQQWNVDILGDESPNADAEVIAVAIAVLKGFGLSPDQVKIKIGHRQLVNDILSMLNVPPALHQRAIDLLDKWDKLAEAQRDQAIGELGLTRVFKTQFVDAASVFEEMRSNRGSVQQQIERYSGLRSYLGLWDVIESRELGDWCVIDISIVRGLAYYTGIVFEIHETTGQERAIAGGGRYDKLVELFGGPSTPAVGLAMGDVVLGLVLNDKGLLKPAEEYLPRPDAFVLAATDEAAAMLPGIVAQLRRENLHARHSSKTTRNVGKLLTDASKARARFAVILGKELEAGNAVLKNLDSGEQRELKLDELVNAVRQQH